MYSFKTFLSTGVVFFVSATLIMCSFCFCFWCFCFYFRCKNKKQSIRSSSRKSAPNATISHPKTPIYKSPISPVTSTLISEQMVPIPPPRSQRKYRTSKEIEMKTILPQHNTTPSLITDDDSDEHIYGNVNVV